MAENYIFDNIKVSNYSRLYLPENLTATNLEVENNSIVESLTTTTIKSGQFSISNNGSLIGPDQDFIKIDVSDLTVQSGSKIMANVKINAQNLLIDSISGISADGKGYPSNEGPGAGSPPAGGTYGGKGGGNSKELYGSSTQPTDLGSGGGGFTVAPGGAGGGAIKIEIQDTLALDGIISANGENGDYDVRDHSFSFGGGGSGGSIYIITTNFTGPGLIQANGGDGGKSDSIFGGGGGGGGRIAIYSQVNNFSEVVQAKGGAGAGYEVGQDGTIYLSE